MLASPNHLFRAPFSYNNICRTGRDRGRNLLQNNRGTVGAAGDARREARGDVSLSLPGDWWGTVRSSVANEQKMWVCTIQNIKVVLALHVTDDYRRGNLLKLSPFRPRKAFSRELCDRIYGRACRLFPATGVRERAGAGRGVTCSNVPRLYAVWWTANARSTFKVLSRASFWIQRRNEAILNAHWLVAG